MNNAFSWNLWSDFLNMWQYDFIRHAFEAGTLVAIVAGVVGYFVVLRRLSFAAHALSHIGFAGAAGAVLINLNPIVGLLVFTSGGGVSMAALGKKAATRDVQIGTVLAFMLGLGVLFISLYKGYATEAYSLLFGEILGINSGDVLVTLIAAVITLLAVALMYRRLLFTSLDEDVAEAKGISIFGMNIAFMLLVALATSIAVQVVGVLLIFALMVTPAAIGERLSRQPLKGITVAVAVALVCTWFGLFISFYQPYPVSFFITTAAFLLYLSVRLVQLKDWTKRDTIEPASN
jgi:zinc/manganese transport system permease protein